MLPVFRLLSSYYRAPSAPWSSRKSGVAFPHVAASRSLWSTLMEEVTIITGAVNAWSGQRSSTGVTLSSQYAYMWHWRRPSIHIMEPHTERIPHTSHLGATQQGHGSSHYASLQYSVSAGASLRTQWQGNRTVRVASGTAVIPITHIMVRASTQHAALQSSWLGAVLYMQIAKAFPIRLPL